MCVNGNGLTSVYDCNNQHHKNHHSISNNVGTGAIADGWNNNNGCAKQQRRYCCCSGNTLDTADIRECGNDIISISHNEPSFSKIIFKNCS